MIRQGIAFYSILSLACNNKEEEKKKKKKKEEEEEDEKEEKGGELEIPSLRFTSRVPSCSSSPSHTLS